ncbi:N,N'-diacetyllegionaminic acid synthase [Moorella thermoacetica]|uniref:N,N'-diacetyllegionaminic acid synthase n=1 Tax=Neomoorella thermoacetica TaxID=1525 RepID=A0AAC9HGI2_NEOTH|nr:N-acetylneuraminate synthase family protein [Moorella thermoacetica]AOQ23410.1 N,N'-diacetyllegionaminic acid synthase [Moorella thermoacetica]TYL13595.1 N,N'-diacetyllegionaminic acid synthase [Moorella thermoacetica]
MEKVQIGSRTLGHGKPVFIIAEAGSNHDGSLAQARQMIEVAAEAGVDAVKFQLYSAETLYSRQTPVFPGEDERPYEMVRKCELPRAWLPELAQYTRQKSLAFLCTPFDYQAVDELEAIGVNAFKWASSEINDIPLLKYTASKGKPMIISTGMSNLADVQEAVDAVRSVGNNDIILLHCVAVYPTPIEEVNLRAMDTLRNAFHLPVGFSDHTLGLTAAIAAVARGACVIEKHFTLDRQLEGPDHKFALEPEELKALVKAIREVEACLGRPEKRPTPGEEEKVLLSRRSIIAAVNISKGCKIEREMLITKRPGYGIPPKFIDIIVGRQAKVDIPKDTPVQWEMI